MKQTNGLKPVTPCNTLYFTWLPTVHPDVLELNGQSVYYDYKALKEVTKALVEGAINGSGNAFQHTLTKLPFVIFFVWKIAFLLLLLVL